MTRYDKAVPEFSIFFEIYIYIVFSISICNMEASEEGSG